MMALPSSARTTSKQEDQRGGNQLGSAIARNIRKAAKIGGLVRNKSKMSLRTLSKMVGEVLEAKIRVSKI